MLGVAFLSVYRFTRRVRAKCFSVLASGGFAAFGKHSVLEPPIRLSGEHRIAIGEGVFVGAGAWLLALNPEERSVSLTIGDRTSVSGYCVISAATGVTLGRGVLLARGVYISDHSHGHADASRPILEQGITAVAPIVIGDGAWLGENVVVCPGVRIGRGAVIGANAVVRDDVPDRCLAVGVPAKVVRHLDADEPALA